jgi:hypothetical protein
MSLGDKTKCDLSFDKAIIDRTELINSLEYQYYTLLHSIKNECDKYINAYQTDMTHKVHYMVSVGDTGLDQRLKQLRKTAELLHTLRDSKSRSEIVWKD